MKEEKTNKTVGAGDNCQVKSEKSNVGVDALVDPKQKGITLIALIITIIVLLILAMVSINIVQNQGLITRTKDATDEYTISQEKEQIAIAYSDYKIGKQKNESYTMQNAIDNNQIEATAEDETDGWTITFTKTGNIYTLTSEGNTEKFEEIISKEEDFLYEENEDGTLTITGVTGNATTLKIPATINGKTVTTIGIGSMNYGSDIYYTEEEVLEKISSEFTEEEINILDDNELFNTLNLEEKKEYYKKLIAVERCELYTNVDGNYTKRKENANCHFNTVILPNTVTTIEEKAFYCCTNLEKITLSSNLQSIGSEAFYRCVNLKEIDFPETLTVIGTSAFSGCITLKDVILPGSLNLVDYCIFSSCYSLENVKVNSGTNKINGHAFSYDVELKTIILPKSITELDMIFEWFDFHQSEYLYNNILIQYEGTEEEWNAIAKSNIPSGATINYNYQY